MRGEAPWLPAAVSEGWPGGEVKGERASGRGNWGKNDLKMIRSLMGCVTGKGRCVRRNHAESRLLRKKVVREKDPVSGVDCGVNVSGNREGKLTSCARGT